MATTAPDEARRSAKEFPINVTVDYRRKRHIDRMYAGRITMKMGGDSAEDRCWKGGGGCGGRSKDWEGRGREGAVSVGSGEEREGGSGRADGSVTTREMREVDRRGSGR
ncbi:hypothetical protein ONZ45_g6867 [Pleurotus djamor]|nr:hypothetical protein ONZ45_g6867 [Pleurotus djamor]